MRLRELLTVPHSLPEDQLFKRMVATSAVVHVLVFLFFGLKAAIFPNDAYMLDPVIKVDMVGLPDKIAELPPQAPQAPVTPEVKEPPKVEPKAETKPEPKVVPKPVPAPAPNKVVLKKDKAQKADALKKIKQLEKEEKRHKALEDIEKEVSQEEAQKAQAERQAKLKQIIKGNAISPGTALHGLMKSEFNDYIAQIHAQVQSHWSLPEWLQNDTLRAQIAVYLDDKGAVTKRVLLRPSGDPRFDNLALQTVDEASPFPAPPAKFVDVVRVDGLILRFPQ